ncbi:MAG: DUF805 domain-containing protein [Burkholderiales bacterium]|nr:DUF805 domain-containing protein [Burkholderiales bacterium]
MATSDPYRAPRSAVRDRPDRYGEVRVLGVRGRLSRVRYIGYSVGFLLLFYLLILAAGAAGAAGLHADLAVGLIVALWIALVVVSLMLTIQRCHDFNTSGWVALLVFIPLVGLLFWFIPGTEGENRFGAMNPPNPLGAVLLATVVPVVFVVGVLAAVAIPAYQDYTVRAKAAGGAGRGAPR